MPWIFFLWQFASYFFYFSFHHDCGRSRNSLGHAEPNSFLCQYLLITQHSIEAICQIRLYSVYRTESLMYRWSGVVMRFEQLIGVVSHSMTDRQTKQPMDHQTFTNSIACTQLKISFLRCVNGGYGGVCQIKVVLFQPAIQYNGPKSVCIKAPANTLLNDGIWPYFQMLPQSLYEGLPVCPSMVRGPLVH